MKSNKGRTSLLELKLKSRTYHCLLRAGIESIEELAALSHIQLIQLWGIGFGSYHHIIARLEAQGCDTTKYPRFE